MRVLDVVYVFFFLGSMSAKAFGLELLVYLKFLRSLESGFFGGGGTDA